MTTAESSGPGNTSPSESVCVAVHVRPLIEQEVEESCVPSLDVPLGMPQVCAGPHSFTYDAVFGADGGREPASLYDTCVAPLVGGLFQGYNATVFAYGQTGSGKTYTMGSSFPQEVNNNIGIIPRVMDSIFNRIRASPEIDFSVRVSFVEIYGEEINDLLLPMGNRRHGGVSIRELPGGGICLAGANEKEVRSQQEMLAVLESGTLMRVTAETGMNKRSSRSHAVFSITVEQRKLPKSARTPRKTRFNANSFAKTETADEEASVNDNDKSVTMDEDTEKDKQVVDGAAPTISGEEDNEEEDDDENDMDAYLCAKMHLVDLAGSERAKRTKAQGQRLQEGININKGLLALGNVINALVEGKVHIPYRDSKLTRMLQDSLGGNSRTLMIACVSPADINLEESLNTLRYANRARAIKNKPVVNRDPIAAQLAFLRQQLAAVRAENSDLKQQLGLDPNERVTGRASEEESAALATALNDAQARAVKLDTQNAKLKVEIDSLRQELTECTERMLTAEMQRDKIVRELSAVAARSAVDDGSIEGEEDAVVANALLASNILKSMDIPDGEESLVKQQEEKIRGLQREVKRLKALTRASGGFGLAAHRIDDGPLATPLTGGNATSMGSAQTPLLARLSPLPGADGTPSGVLLGSLGDGQNTEEREFVEEQQAHHAEMRAVQVQLDALQRQLEMKEKAAAAVSGHAALKNSFESQLQAVSKERDSLAKERGELLKKLKTIQTASQQDKAAVEREYRARIKELDQKVKDASNKELKIKQLENTRARAMDTVKALERDIQEIKTQKIVLTKQMEKANKDFNAWRRAKDKELMQLRKVGRANAAQLTRLEALQAKQQEVLRRKMEEAAVARRRLKELEDVKKSRRAATDGRNSGGDSGSCNYLSEYDYSGSSSSAVPLAVLSGDEQLRRDWLEKELDSCCASHDLQKVLEGEKALRMEAARQLRDVERRIAALKNPQWWPGMKQLIGRITAEALERKKIKLEHAMDLHSKSIQDLQLHLIKTRAEEEERGAGAADPRRWAGIPGGPAAQALAITMFRAAAQQKAALYESQFQLTEASEEVEMLRLKLEVAVQERMEAERVAAEAQAAVNITPATTPCTSSLNLSQTAKDSQPSVGGSVSVNNNNKSTSQVLSDGGGDDGQTPSSVNTNHIQRKMFASTSNDSTTEGVAIAAAAIAGITLKDTETAPLAAKEDERQQEPPQPVQEDVSQEELEASLAELLASLQQLPTDLMDPSEFVDLAVSDPLLDSDLSMQSNGDAKNNNANNKAVAEEVKVKLIAGTEEAGGLGFNDALLTTNRSSLVSDDQEKLNDALEEDDVDEDELEDEDDETSSEDEADAWDPSTATPYVIASRRKRRPASGAEQLGPAELAVLTAVNAERQAAGKDPVQRLTVATLKEMLAGKSIGGAEWKGAGKKKADLLRDFSDYLAEQQQTAQDIPLASTEPAATVDDTTDSNVNNSGKKKGFSLRRILSPSKSKPSAEKKRGDEVAAGVLEISVPVSIAEQVVVAGREGSGTSPRSPLRDLPSSLAKGLDTLTTTEDSELSHVDYSEDPQPQDEHNQVALGQSDSMDVDPIGDSNGSRPSSRPLSRQNSKDGAPLMKRKAWIPS